MHFFISIKSSVFHAIRFGSGSSLLICFHGFGEDAEKFLTLQDSLSQRYTLVAIDLPFHGTTRWNSRDEFTKDDLASLIRQIMEREQRPRFSLMGYSLGGKLVLSAILKFAAQLDEVILVAPDGVKKSTWYNIAVYPGWGRKLFLRFVKRPQFVFIIAKAMYSIGLLSERFYKFLQYQTNTQEKRRKVYDTWLTLKNFSVHLPEVKSLLKMYSLKCMVFVGRYDLLVSKQTGERLTTGVPTCTLIVLEKGHNLVTEALNEPLKQALK